MLPGIWGMRVLINASPPTVQIKDISSQED